MPTYVPGDNIKVSDFIINWTWDLNKLNDVLPPEFINLIFGIAVPISSVWGYYSVALPYLWYQFFTSTWASLLIAPLNGDQDYCPKWWYVWSLYCAPKVKYFIWALLKNNLPTRDKLSKKMKFIPLRYPFCDICLEIREHLFFECPNVSFIWGYIRDKYSLQLPGCQINLAWFWNILKLSCVRFDVLWRYCLSSFVVVYLEK